MATQPITARKCLQIHGFSKHSSRQFSNRRVPDACLHKSVPVKAVLIQDALQKFDDKKNKFREAVKKR